MPAVLEFPRRPEALLTRPTVASSGPSHRYELPVDAADAEIASARLWAAGARGVWEQPGRLVAWFPSRTAAVPPGGRWRVEPDRDWQAEWKATIGPVHAGRVTVVPSWLVAAHRPRPCEVTVVVDPGRAFGTGHHATTTMCLELLDDLDLAGRTVADVGCGTGILAIAAALRGARTIAVDVDPDAVRVARDNAAANRVDVDVRLGSVEALPSRCDVVVANLVTDVILAAAAPLAAAAGDVLVVSGVAASRRPPVETALRAEGIDVTDRRERDGWSALRGRVRAGVGRRPVAPGRDRR